MGGQNINVGPYLLSIEDSSLSQNSLIGNYRILPVLFVFS